MIPVNIYIGKNTSIYRMIEKSTIKPVIAIVLPLVLYFIYSQTHFSYVYLEFFFALLLLVIFLSTKKSKKRSESNMGFNILSILSISFFFYPIVFAYKIAGNLFFNSVILIILFSWVFIFGRYFRLGPEERLPILKQFFEIRELYEAVGILISMIFLKMICDIQILGKEFTITHESLSSLYAAIAQVFGTILSITIMMAIFILEYENEKITAHERTILARGLKGIFLLASSVFCLSIIGIIPNMPLSIGADMPKSINTALVLMFFLTMVLSAYCIMFIGMLLQELLGRRINESMNTL